MSTNNKFLTPDENDPILSPYTPPAPKPKAKATANRIPETLADYIEETNAIDQLKTILDFIKNASTNHKIIIDYNYFNVDNYPEILLSFEKPTLAISIYSDTTRLEIATRGNSVTLHLPNGIKNMEIDEKHNQLTIRVRDH